MGIASKLRSYDQTFSPIVWLDFLIVLLSLYFLNELGITSAFKYILLVLIGVTILVFGSWMFREGDFIKDLFPVNYSLDKDIIVRFLGLLLPLILLAIPSTLFFAYNPLTMAPLTSFSTGSSTETFAAIKAAASPQYSGFLIIMGASRIEEMILGLTFVIGGVFSIYLFIMIAVGLANKGISVTEIHRRAIKHRTALFVGGMILSILFFTILHIGNNTYLNIDGSYNVKAFSFAAFFRLSLNVLIYKITQFGLSFSIGVHQMWNTIAIGWVSAKAFYFSPIGMIFILYDALLFLFMINRYKFALKELGKIFTFKSKIGLRV